MTEAEMLAPVLDAIRDQGWTVYEEVRSPHGSARCDAYCTLETEGLTLTWAIEGKRSLSLSLIEQAEYWTRYAHYVSVVVPQGRRGNGGYGGRLLRRIGVGLLGVDSNEPRRAWGIDGPFISGASGIRPRFHRPVAIPELVPAQQQMASAGTNGGGYWTPFQETLRALSAQLETGRPVRFSDAMDAIEHHYASDRSGVGALSALIRSGTVKGVRVFKDGRRLLVEKTEPKIYTGRAE